MSAAKPLTREKRLANYGEPLTVVQARQVRKTDLRREHSRPRKQRARAKLFRRLRKELGG
jgi:hypothetical protein